MNRCHKNTIKHQQFCSKHQQRNQHNLKNHHQHHHQLLSPKTTIIQPLPTQNPIQNWTQILPTTPTQVRPSTTRCGWRRKWVGTTPTSIPSYKDPSPKTTRLKPPLFKVGVLLAGWLEMGWRRVGEGLGMGWEQVGEGFGWGEFGRGCQLVGYGLVVVV